MRKIEVPKLIEPWRIICAAQSEPDYSEGRYILKPCPFCGGRAKVVAE